MIRSTAVDAARQSDAIAAVMTQLSNEGARRLAEPRKSKLTLHRLRRQAAPHAIAAALMAAGWTAELAAFITGHRGLVASIVALATFGTLALVAAIARGRIPRHRRRWAAVCGLSASTWLTLAAFGMTLDMVAALLVAQQLLAARWWRTVRIPNPTEVPAPIRSKREITEVPELWEENVGNAGGSLPGSHLHPVSEPFEHGDIYRGQLARGKQAFSDLTAALPKVSTALDVRMENLVLDRDPERPSRFTLKVVKTSPIRGGVLFEKPRHEIDGDTVRLPIGPYADGIGEASWQLYTRNRMWGGFILGGIGSGKTRVEEGIAINALDLGNTLLIYLDGQGGASSPTLFEHATLSGGPDKADAILEGLLRIGRARQMFNRVHRQAGFTPDPFVCAHCNQPFQRPGILVMVDECHGIFTPQNAAAWALVAREFSKLGIAPVGADQSYNLAETFGGSDVLRSSLVMGNLLVMRTMSNSDRIMVPGLELDPRELPELPGYGYKAGASSRVAPCRGAYLPDNEDKARDPQLTVPSVTDWMRQLPGAELEAIAATAAGQIFLERHLDAAYDRAKDEAVLEMLEAGDVSFLAEGGFEFPTAKPSGGDECGQVVTFPGAITAESLTSPTPAGLTEYQRKVFEAIRGGAHRPADIMRVTGYGETRVRQLRDELLGLELIRQASFGHYELAERVA